MARRPWTRGRGFTGQGRKAPESGKKQTNSKKRAAPWPTSSDGEVEGSSVSARKKVRWNAGGRSSRREQESGAEEDDDDESEQFQPGQTFVAITSNRLRVGCAYFDSSNGVLYLLEDTQDGEHYDFTKQLLEQTNPDYVVMSSKADEKFITVCREFMTQKNRGWQVRPHREFTVTKGKDKLYSLPLLADFVAEGTLASSDSGAPTPRAPSLDAYSFQNDRGASTADPALVRWQASIRVANFVETERSPLCMACVGGLLEHLHRTRAFGALGDDTAHLVNNIEILRLNQAMHINMDALLSLQIFQEENHASMHSDKTKEGLSLFGTLNYTRTRAGYDLLRQWFLRPSLSLEVIAERHSAIACFLHTDNLTISGALRTHLKGVRNVPHLLLAMKKGKTELRSLVALCSFVFHSAMIAEGLEGLVDADAVDIVRKLSENFASASFTEMGEDIHKIIDLDESTQQSRICVRAGIDVQLDELKETYDRLDSVMNNVSVQIAGEVPHDVVPALNVVYFPQLGFLISVPLPEGWNNEQPLFGVPDWQYQFNTESTVFFKSPKMRDLDYHIGDIQTMISELELDIVHALTERVMPYAPAIEATCAILAELDCLLSFAQASLVQGYTRPLMSEENVLAIRGGRHPLHEQVVDTFIPNDAFLIGGAGLGTIPEDEDEDEEPPAEATAGILEQKGRSVMVITGANACGKSVYLKQVALIQYMAQIGCFVPAESATLGVVDKIFTRVQARESISKVQSSFMIDLNQVSLALRNVTTRSLVLLDEFGKGTLDTDGAGLLIGVLRHLLALGADCPKVLATTHFRDVFRDDVVPRSLPLALAHMRIMLVQQQQGDESIVYLHQAAAGLSLESHAAKCAAVCGLPKAVVQRAQYVTERVAQHEVGALLDEQMSPAEEEELQEAEDVFRRFVQWKLGDDDEDEASDTRAKMRHVLGLEDRADEKNDQ